MNKIAIDDLVTLPEIISKVESLKENETEFENWLSSALADNPLNLNIVEAYALGRGKKILTEKPVNQEEVPPVALTKKHIWRSKFFWFFLTVFFLFTIGGSLLALFFLPQAKLTIYPTKEVLSKTLTVVLKENNGGSNEPIDFLAVRKIAVEEKNQKDFLTSGENTIGEVARGQVTIQNWTDADLTFSAGALIKTEGGNLSSSLSFALEKEAVVPRQTFSSPSPGQKLYQAGTVTVGVQAQDFGQSYNLAVGTTFTVTDKSFSQVSAVAANNFTGGSSQKVKIFSQGDKTKSTAVLSADLFDKGLLDLESKLLGDEILIKNSVIHKITSVNYSQELGAQALSVNLSMTTQSQGLAYSQSSLRKLVLLQSRDSVPAGLVFLDRPDFLEVKDVSFTSLKNTEADVSVKMILISKMDLDSLKNNLLGKNLDVLRQEIGKLKGVDKYTYETWPSFLTWLKRVPFKSDRFLVEIRVE